MAAHIYCVISDRSALTLKNPKTVKGKEMRKCDINTPQVTGRQESIAALSLGKRWSRGPGARVPAALMEANFSLSLKLIKPAETASPNGLNEIFN